MAINPGSDLLSDALLAAEPQRTKAAAERLASSAAHGDPQAAPKSMFAQSLANTTSHAKITRLAHDLEQRARRAKS